MADFTKIRSLYEKNLYLQAFREAAGLGVVNAQVEDLSIEELLLGSRLAARLGGPRVSRWLVRTAMDRDPDNGWVRFAGLFLRSPKKQLLHDLRKFEDAPDLGGMTRSFELGGLRLTP